MKPKKTIKADIDAKVGQIRKVGFIIAVFLTILAFKWTTEENKNQSFHKGPEISEAEEIVDLIRKDVKNPIIQATILKVIQPGNPQKEDTTAGFDVEFREKDSLVITFDDNDREKDDSEIVPFYVVEDKPTFPGGEEAMLKFITANAKYPETELYLGIQGVVHLSFIVNENGSLSNIQIAKGVTPNMNNEALRVAALMPRWIPGKQRGKAVRVPVSIPVRFIIRD